MNEPTVRTSRRWGRLCLLTGLALLTLLAATCGPNLLWLWRTNVDIAAIREAVTPYGGSVSTPPGGIDFWRRDIDVAVDLDGASIGDAELERISRFIVFKYVYLINISGSRLTDAGLRVLENHPKLFGLNLSRTGVSDKAMGIVATMPRLNTLILSGTKISDAGLEVLKRRHGPAPPLLLDVTDTAVTEEGIRRLFAAYRLWNFSYGPSASPKTLR